MPRPSSPEYRDYTRDAVEDLRMWVEHLSEYSEQRKSGVAKWFSRRMPSWTIRETGVEGKLSLENDGKTSGEVEDDRYQGNTELVWRLSGLTPFVDRCKELVSRLDEAERLGERCRETLFARGELAGETWHTTSGTNNTGPDVGAEDDQLTCFSPEERRAREIVRREWTSYTEFGALWEFKAKCDDAIIGNLTMFVFGPSKTLFDVLEGAKSVLKEMGDPSDPSTEKTIEALTGAQKPFHPSRANAPVINFLKDWETQITEMVSSGAQPKSVAEA